MSDWKNLSIAPLSDQKRKALLIVSPRGTTKQPKTNVCHRVFFNVSSFCHSLAWMLSHVVESIQKEQNTFSSSGLDPQACYQSLSCHWSLVVFLVLSLCPPNGVVLPSGGPPTLGWVFPYTLSEPSALLASLHRKFQVAETNKCIHRRSQKRGWLWQFHIFLSVFLKHWLLSMVVLMVSRSPCSFCWTNIFGNGSKPSLPPQQTPPPKKNFSNKRFTICSTIPRKATSFAYSSPTRLAPQRSLRCFLRPLLRAALSSLSVADLQGLTLCSHGIRDGREPGAVGAVKQVGMAGGDGRFGVFCCSPDWGGFVAVCLGCFFSFWRIFWVFGVWRVSVRQIWHLALVRRTAGFKHWLTKPALPTAGLTY